MPYNNGHYNWHGNQPNKRYHGGQYQSNHSGSSGYSRSYESGSRNGAPNSSNANSSGYRRDFHERGSGSYYRGRDGFKRGRSSQYDRYNPAKRYQGPDRRDEEPPSSSRENRPKQSTKPAFELNSLQDPESSSYRNERRDSKSSVSSRSSLEDQKDRSPSIDTTKPSKEPENHATETGSKSPHDASSSGNSPDLKPDQKDPSIDDSISVKVETSIGTETDSHQSHTSLPDKDTDPSVQSTPAAKKVTIVEPSNAINTPTGDHVDSSANQHGNQETTKPPASAESSKSSTLTDFSGSVSDNDVFKLGTISENKDVEEQHEDLSEAETVISETNPSTENASKLMKELSRKESHSEHSHEESEYSDSSESERNVVKVPKRRTGKRPYVIKRDASGSSILQRACKKGLISEVEEMIDRGADPNECDFCGFTCLHEASLAGHTEVVKLLIEKGADVNKQAFEAGDLETPLIDAADNKHLEIVKILLDNGADPRIFNSDGFSALTKIHNQHKDEEGYEEIIHLLEEANNKFSKMDPKSASPLKAHSASPDIIVEDPNDAYFGELLRKKNHAASVYKYAAEGIKDLTVQYLVEGGRLDYKPDVLILAARNGHVELVDIMLGLVGDYDVNLENKLGLTALLASVGRGHLEVVKFLLSKGSNPFMRRKPDNLNALEIAQRSPNFDPEEVAAIESSMKKNANYSILSKSPPDIAVADNKAATKSSDLKRKSSSTDLTEEKRTKKARVKVVEGPSKSSKDHERSASFQKSNSYSGVSDDDEASGIVPKPSSMFSKAKTPETDHNLKSKETTASPGRAKHSISPSPQPMTKAQIELKEKNAQEAKIWQEKVEAKKKARRDMFLKSEKEKERKKKEDQIKKIEEVKQQELMKIQEEEKKLKEIEEETKRVSEKKAQMEIDLIIQSYPIGLRYARFGVPLSDAEVYKFSPVYVFNIDGEAYATDLQIALVTGETVPNILEIIGSDSKKEASIEDKAKMWKLFFPLIGTHGPSENLADLMDSGFEKFLCLQIHFIKLKKVTPFVKEKYPNSFGLIWGTSRFIRVEFASLKEFIKVARSVKPQHKTPFNVNVVTAFIPPKLKNRPDIVKAIHDAKTPMW